MFRKAERKKAKLRLALCGVSGSGKTLSSLLIAKGIGGRIALLDTENGSAEVYAENKKFKTPPFDIVRMDAPFTPEKYIEVIKTAEKDNYDTLIIDSLTHEWSGQGGILDIVENITNASRSKNSHFSWRTVTPRHTALIQAIVSSKINIIATMRSKQKSDSVLNESGKLAPVKIGMGAIQREGTEYEFTVVLELSLDGHIASATTDKTTLFGGLYEKPSEATGKMLVDWLNEGVDVDPYQVILEDAHAKMGIMMPFDELKKVFTTFWVRHKDDAVLQEKIRIIYEEYKQKLTVMVIEEEIANQEAA